MANKSLAMMAMGKPMEGDEDAPADVEGDENEGLEQAMADLLDAIKAEDPMAMAAAFADASALAE